MTALVTQVNSAVATALAADQSTAIEAALTPAISAALITAIQTQIAQTLVGSTNTNAAVFTKYPNIGRVRLAAANLAKDGSGALGLLFTPGTNGSRINQIFFNSAQASRAASSAMTGCIFLTDTAGANPYLLAEIILPTVTASATAIGQSQQISFYNGLVIPAGMLVKATISVYAGVQDQYDVWAIGGDF